MYGRNQTHLINNPTNIFMAAKKKVAKKAVKKTVKKATKKVAKKKTAAKKK